MKKKFVKGLIVLIIILFTLSLTACKKQKEIIGFSIKSEDITGNLSDEKTFNELEIILNEVNWSPNTQVSMSFKEDCQFEVIYKEDHKKSKTTYLVWFKGDQVEFVSSDTDESYGVLSNSENLKKLIGFKLTTTKNLPDYQPKTSDVVNGRIKIINLDRFLTFFEHVKQGKMDHVRVVDYTIEGDPILHDIEYNGTTIKSTVDSRRDKFGEGEIRSTICKSIEFKNKNYVLIGCEDSDVQNYLLSAPE